MTSKIASDGITEYVNAEGRDIYVTRDHWPPKILHTETKGGFLERATVAEAAERVTSDFGHVATWEGSGITVDVSVAGPHVDLGYWHRNLERDEMYIVLEGAMYVDTELEKTIVLRPGDMMVVPRGVSHKATTRDEGMRCLMLFTTMSMRRAVPAEVGGTAAKFDEPR